MLGGRVSCTPRRNMAGWSGASRKPFASIRSPRHRPAKRSLAAPKQAALDRVHARAGDLSEWTSTIWHLPEPAWPEYRPAASDVERLRSGGFGIEEGSGAMPTAFCARWSNGDGPVVGAFAEYDAVPGSCQQAAPAPAPGRGLSLHAAAHTDSHTALEFGALGGAAPVRGARSHLGFRPAPPSPRRPASGRASRPAPRARSGDGHRARGPVASNRAPNWRGAPLGSGSPPC